jgi:nickel-dependent lactate racemase
MDEAGRLSEIRAAAAALPRDRLLYHIRPAPAGARGNWKGVLTRALQDPIGTPPLGRMARPGNRVVILADDLTRPTPQRKILPALLDCLHEAGVADEDVTVIIALGTHRYMTEAEIRDRFGEAACARVPIVNHTWADADSFVDLGSTPSGTPVQVNRTAYEADLLIGTGSIVPHIYAGWGGGAKIVQPGVCSAQTTARTHCMAADGGDLLGMPGRVENPVRREMEQVAAVAGLDFVLNVVVDASGAPVWAGAGDSVQAHRAGVRASAQTYVRSIPRPADVALVDAHPAVADYWQGIKALAHACRGIKRGGTAVLVGEFPDSISPTHPELARHTLKPYEAMVKACQVGEVEDAIASATLRLHGLIMDHCRVICVSPGMGAVDKHKLGFGDAPSVAEALRQALDGHDRSATVGIIECGGDVLPQVGQP